MQTLGGNLEFRRTLSQRRVHLDQRANSSFLATSKSAKFKTITLRLSTVQNTERQTNRQTDRLLEHVAAWGVTTVATGNHYHFTRGGPTGAVQLKQLASDYSQQKHTTWADNYCSIKG